MSPIASHVKAARNLRLELLLLTFLALLWESSYLFIKVAVIEIPPLTLIAARVLGAALFLHLVFILQREKLPRDRHTIGMLGIQAIFNSIGAWTILAWGQQFVGAGLASVLNTPGRRSTASGSAISAPQLRRRAR